MDQEIQNNDFRNVPHDAEAFGMARKDSEDFGTVPKSAEPFRNVPKHSERNENHTLSVREAARMFEEAGVMRTERSIVNWCQPNKDGMARLDSYFDPNERKYFITSQSVEAAIQEEWAKAVRNTDTSEPAGNIPKPAETREREHKREPQRSETSEDSTRVKELEQEVMDLKITNRAKDYFIDQLKNDRQSLVQEQHSYVERLMTFSRQVGELRTKLFQLGTGKEISAQEANLGVENSAIDSSNV